MKSEVGGLAPDVFKITRKNARKNYSPSFRMSLN